MDNTYWQKQKPTKPLFPDLEWSKPERRDQSGNLGIIGGNKLGFASVAENYNIARDTGVGQVRVLLPDGLKKIVPPTMTDVLFGAMTPSGSLSKDALPELKALADWADGVLLIGDAGRNSETAVAYEKFINEFDGQLTITRDAIDLVKNSTEAIVNRPDTVLVASFSQVQQIFKNVYYPKVITFSMQLQQLVEALHKFTMTYPVTIMTLHQEHIVIAHDGKIVTQPFDSPMQIWHGTTATKVASYWLWSPDKPLESAATSLVVS